MQRIFHCLRLAPLLVLLMAGLPACQEGEAPPDQSDQPATTSQPGMRAYVDPVTGEYAPPPPVEEAPKAPAGAASVVTPEPQPPEEVTVPKGGVMIELDDRIRVEQQTAE